MTEIKMTIDEEGNSTIEVNGMAGRGCADVTRALEAAIGVTTGDVKKPEFAAGQGHSNAAGRTLQA